MNNGRQRGETTNVQCLKILKEDHNAGGAKGEMIESPDEIYENINI